MPVDPAPVMHPAPRPARLRLPGPAVAVGGPSWFEAVVFSAVVPLLAIPLLLATMAAVWAVSAALAFAAAAAWLTTVRRVVVGHGWVADRRLLRWRITAAEQLRTVELVDTAHGGVLRLHRASGRPHRLRRTEVDAPATRQALAALVAASPAACPRVARALSAAAGA